MKIDQNQKLWFLWCGSCRISQEVVKNKILPKQVVNTTIRINHQPIKFSNFVKTSESHKKIYSLSLRNPAEIVKRHKCPNCLNMFVSEEIVFCELEIIIQSFEFLGANENKFEKTVKVF